MFDELFDAILERALKGMSLEEREGLLESLRTQVPEDVRVDLDELAEIHCRFDRRLKRNQALVMEDVMRWNELCYKHYARAQDIPASLCGLGGKSDG